MTREIFPLDHLENEHTTFKDRYVPVIPDRYIPSDAKSLTDGATDSIHCYTQ